MPFATVMGIVTAPLLAVICGAGDGAASIQCRTPSGLGVTNGTGDGVMVGNGVGLGVGATAQCAVSVTGEFTIVNDAPVLFVKFKIGT